MSATLMNAGFNSTPNRSGKYLASAMLFGAMYFLLSFLCPGEQVTSGGVWSSWMNLAAALVLGGTLVGYRLIATERSHPAKEM